MSQYITNDIDTARCKLLAELQEPTRLEINKVNAKRVASECGIELPHDWAPAAGEFVGKIFGIPMYINPEVDEFVMFGSRKR